MSPSLRPLLVALFLVLAPAPARAQSDASLVERFEQAEAAGNHAQALEAALAITARHPESSIWAFNAARMHALLNHPQDAIAFLKKAADAGYSGIDSLDHHTDLDSLRTRPDFAPVRAAIRANADTRIAEFRAAALAHTHPVYTPRKLPKDVRPGAIIALHGSGGNGSQMLQACRAACNELGMICIAPDAIRAHGNGYAWTYRDEATWLIEHMVDVAVNEHGADPQRIYLVGFSQGANIALVLAKTRPQRFAGIIPVCGQYEPHLAALADNATPPPMCLITGQRDRARDTYTQAEADFTALGAPANLRIVEGMGHSMIKGKDLTDAIAWCASARIQTRDTPRPAN